MMPTMSKKQSYLIPLVLFFACIAASYLLVDVHQGRSAIFAASKLGLLTVLQFSLAAGCMLLLWYQFSRQKQGVETTKAIRHILWVAILARVILIPLPSYTSNDMSRYLFDGQIVLSGFDPYSVTHEAPALQVQRARWHPPAEQAKYVTIYPPLALALFSASAYFGPEFGPLFWKFLVCLASIATLWIGYLLLKNAKKLQHLPLLALSPLLILESGIGAHIDTFSTLAVCAALLAWQASRASLCGFFIGLGILLKLTPILLLGPLFFAFSAKKHKYDEHQQQHPLISGLSMGISAVLTVQIVYLAALLSGYQSIGSLKVFFQKWRFGSPLFNALESMLSAPQLIGITAAFIGLGLLSIAVFSWLQLQQNLNHYRPARFVHLFQWVLALPLLISPVVFPWYLMPLVPLLALSPNFSLLAWICLLPLTYEVLGPFAQLHIWLPASWPLMAIACGFMVGLLHLIAIKAKKYYRIPLPIII